MHVCVCVCAHATLDLEHSLSLAVGLPKLLLDLFSANSVYCVFLPLLTVKGLPSLDVPNALVARTLSHIHTCSSTS